MKKCEICDKTKEDSEIDSKLIGLGATPDGWICKQCVSDSENAGHVDFGSHDGALHIPDED